MSTVAVTLVALAAITYVLKAAGPLALAGRTLPERVNRIVVMLPIPLFAALIVTSTVADGERWAFDARLVGVAAAALALWRRAPFIAVVVIAGAATALTRAVAG